MDEQIKQIAERLRGLRDALELSPEEVAKACQLSADGKRDGGYLGKRVASDCANVWRRVDYVDVWRRAEDEQLLRDAQE